MQLPISLGNQGFASLYEKRYQTSSESFGIFFRVITFW